MIPSELPVLLSLYTQIAPGELFRQLQRNLGVHVHDGIYTPRVLIWMLIAERLDPRGTLVRSVEQLAQGRLDALLSCCKRARTKQIALATGGYSQARQHLPRMLVERSMEELVQQLRRHLQGQVPEVGRNVYVVDGSSIQLQDATLAAAYPPSRNQHGQAHWPMVRMVVLHDVETGLAERPCWSPQNGPEAVSEQGLADRAMAVLPPGAVIIGDRNFGIFAIAYSAHLRGHDSIVRLMEKRARALLGRAIAEAGSFAVQWRPSKFEQAKLPELPSDAGVDGYLIAWRVGRGKHQQWLYLFTTLSIPPEQVVALYGLRWNVETDLRSLKQTFRLERLCVRSVDMLDKELMVAVIGYNLVRAIMCLAARTVGVSPRRLSFTYAHNIVHDGYATILAATSYEAQIQQLQHIIALVARCKLPRRTKPRSYPRRVWGRGYRFPARHPEEN